MLARIALLITTLLSSGLLSAPLNLRHPAPSPDGSRICFSYAGDLWLVSANGGHAERLTAHVGYDAYPSWSPDGRYIAFSSIRHGNFDVYVISAQGDKEKRVTYHSADDFVSGWTPDSKMIIFDSFRELHNHCIFEVNPFEERPRPLTRIHSTQGRVSPDGKKLLFCRGYVPWWRKGYRGSAACNLYVKDLGNNQIGQFTAHNGNDLEGYWLPSGEEIIYLSDSTGSCNIFKKNVRTGVTDQLTLHRMAAAFPSVAADGSLICYELGGELWLYDLGAGLGSKLSVTIPTGYKTNPVETLYFDSDATEMKLSPDGSMIAYVVYGEIFCMSVDGHFRQRLTYTVADERGISWSSDSRELAFVSNREDGYDIYRVRSSDNENPSLARSHGRNVTRLMESDAWESQPLISPDNSKVAFVRSKAELIVTDKRGLEGRKLSERSVIHDLAWSPDSRYLIFTLVDEDWFKDIYVADSEGGKRVNLTQSPGNYSRPRFSADGKMIYFLKDGQISYVFLQREIAEMSAWERREYLEGNGNGADQFQPVQIDFEGISDRAIQVGKTGSVAEVAAGPECCLVYYSTAAGEIWGLSLDTGQKRLLAANLDSPRHLQYNGADQRLYFSDQSGRFFSLEPETGSLRSHSYLAQIEVDRREQRQMLFQQAWGLLREQFYDESLHGRDWGELRDAYKDRVAAVETDYDLYDIIREMVGELNASHLAIWPENDAVNETGYLGIIPDFDNTGSGIKIEAIIPGSPADRAVSRLEAGEKITDVEGRSIKGKENCYRHLAGTAGKEIRLDLITREGMTRKTVIRPLSSEEYRALEQEHWEALNRRMVEEASKGKAAYVYLPRLDDESVDNLGHELALHASGRQVLIIDIRGNIGGSAHDRLLDLLSSRAYVRRMPRRGPSGSDGKPLFDGKIALLVNELTSSDAELLAHGFGQLGLGTVLGTRTYGAVIGTETETLLDGSRFGVPTVGWYTLSGENLENRGVAPDISIPANLTLLEKGEDSQLQRALEQLLGSLEER